MFKYTRVALTKTVEDLKTLSHLTTIVTQVLYLAYMVYAIISAHGNLVVNVVLGTLTFGYLLFYLLTYKKDKKLKTARKATKRIYKAIKLSVNAFTLVVAVYSILITDDTITRFSVVSILITAFMVISWAVQTFLMLFSIYAERKINFLMESFFADMEKVMKPINTVNNFVKRLKREEPEPQAERVSQKTREVLDGLVEKHEEKKRENVLQRKQAWKATKLRKKEDKRQEKQAKKQAKENPSKTSGSEISPKKSSKKLKQEATPVKIKK